MAAYRITGNVFTYDPGLDVMGLVWWLPGPRTAAAALTCSDPTPVAVASVTARAAALTCSDPTPVSLECD